MADYPKHHMDLFQMKGTSNSRDLRKQLCYDQVNKQRFQE